VNPNTQIAPGSNQLESALTGVSNLRRWSIVGLLFAASLINYLDRATISMALPLVAKDFGLGPIEKGRLLSAFFLSYAVMQIPIGWCADRFNLRWLYAGAFALWSLAQGLTGFAGSLAVLMAFRMLLGVGESVYLPGGSKIVSMLFPPRERGLPSGVFDFGVRTGLVLEGLVIPWLLVHYGWRRTFAVVGFSALLWLVPWLLVSPRRLLVDSQTQKRTGFAQTLLQFLAILAFSTLLALPVFLSPFSVIALLLLALSLIFVWPQREARPGTPAFGAFAPLLRLLVHLHNRKLLGICLGFFCFDYYWYLLVSWLPDYLVTVRHLTILRAGFYTSLPFFVFGIAEPFGGWMADRLTKQGMSETHARKGIVTVAFLTGLLLIPASRVESATAAILLIMGGSLVGLAIGNLIAIVQCCAPPGEVGVWTGIENFAGNIAGILAPLTTGTLIHRTGSYAPGFALAAIVLVAGLLPYWFIVGELKPTSA